MGTYACVKENLVLWHQLLYCTYPTRYVQRPITVLCLLYYLCTVPNYLIVLIILDMYGDKLPLCAFCTYNAQSPRFVLTVLDYLYSNHNISATVVEPYMIISLIGKNQVI